MSKSFWSKVLDHLAWGQKVVREPVTKPFPKAPGPPVMGQGRSNDDSIPAKLSEGIAVLDHGELAKWADNAQTDDRWKLKLRLLRQKILDFESASLRMEYAEGYSDGLDKAVDLIDDMLGETEEEMVR